jgi:chemotaxis protein methyltransferase CheR
MDDDQFRKLLAYLDYSWEGYRKVRKGVKKRVSRHMQQLNCRDVTAYLRILDRQPTKRQECELLMTVSISRFFRDRRLWEMLESRWLPEIIASNPLKVRVWSAGCGCGQEPYSFKIVWEHLKKHFGSLPSLEITATDRHPGYLEYALNGVYNFSSLKKVAVEDRNAFFESRKGAKQFAVRQELKSDINWEIHHLLNDPPDSDFNIIFLRNNVLTYCLQEIQKKALSGIINCLLPGGLFIIGCHERLPIMMDCLVTKNRFSYVYHRKQ